MCLQASMCAHMQEIVAEEDPHNNYQGCAMTLFLSRSLYKRYLWKRKVEESLEIRMNIRSKVP